MSEDYDVSVRGLIEDKRRDSQQTVEPASGLVHGLADKVRGEVLFEELFVFKRIVVLGKRHRA